jgi:ComF family protein
MDSPIGGAVCEGCWGSIRFFTPPLCGRCGTPLAPMMTAPTAPCPRCAAHQSPIARSGALGPYEGVLRDLVHLLKYGGRRSVAPRLASLVRQQRAELLAGADAVVPVPLHWRRQWSRGFNQADAISLGLGPPRWRLLRRTRRTRPQADLEAGERRRNVLGAFALCRGPRAVHLARRLPDACVVLVDDVSTTGATLEACAAVLRDAGAAEVRAVTVARTLLGADRAPGTR